MKKTLQLLVIMIALWGCSSSKQQSTDYFPGFSNAGESGKAKMEWRFPGADKIIIENLGEHFSEFDSVFVSPNENMKYKFRIFRDGDTLERNWRVYIDVRKRQDTFAYSNTPRNLSNSSFEESKYFNGILANPNIQEPYYIKIVRSICNPAVSDTCIVRTLVLDRFGNYLPGFTGNDSAFWSAIYYCTLGMVGEDIKIFTEKEFKDQGNYLDISILLDISAASFGHDEILNSIKHFAAGQRNFDNVMLSLFNQNYDEVINLGSAKKIPAEIDNLKLPETGGLNSLNKATYFNLNNLKGVINNNQKLLVLVAFNDDNNSIFYELDDVTHYARNNEIPVYVIAVGNDIDSYSLKYLTAFTGGRYYSLSDDELGEIGSILNEIAFSQRAYYEFKLPLVALKAEDCEKLRSEIVFHLSEQKHSDIFRVVVKEDYHPPRSQVVATFGYKDTTVNRRFHRDLNILAELLYENPDFKIELIGHSGIEGSWDENSLLSGLRAQAIKDLLLDNRVDSEQVKVTAAGSSKPLYYLEQDEWQKEMNRRVEIRWLDPALLPYEIIADNFDTEEEALTNVEKWEKRGFRSYYERYLKNNIPLYLVKIWGYPTVEEAEKEVKKLGRKYNANFQVE